MIGIGITAYKRPEIDEMGIRNILQMTPLHSKLHIAKDIEGISKAKNDCLKNLDVCDHVFLFDSDCWPKQINWFQPYINSGINHLCMTWGRNIIKTENGIVHYELPNGCMLYLTRKCIETVGGFDEKYIKWGYEHVDYSQRIFNAGLTESKFMDLGISGDLIYSLDKQTKIQSSVPDRQRYIPANMKRLREQWNSKEYKPYK